MNSKTSRSSLKKLLKKPDEEVDTARTKRRISFSGKKFVREFDTEEKPRDYDNSYEISDHTNGEDSSAHSNGTTVASLSQNASHWSMHNNRDKENCVGIANNNLAEVHNRLVCDQNYPLSDYRLNLQTSINITLLPDEQRKIRRHTESSQLEVTTSDSISLDDAERAKLREISVYKLPVSEKTIDLLPEKLKSAWELENKNIENSVIMPADSGAKETEVRQKTVLFENKDMTCDFSDIEFQELQSVVNNVAAPAQANPSDDMKYSNYFDDDSPLTSPLIPFDVVSENRIRKKLNFRELNEELNAGRIQLFPNGPKTPSTDRKVKHRPSYGLEHQFREGEVPSREVIQPRGTLNFNESMMMSPAPQNLETNLLATIDNADHSIKTKSSPKEKRNYRFSQADEQMLDNTNFLVHAKIGDETNSRNSSKYSSRREVTYDNTAMELDDLEKREAAVTEALKCASKHRYLISTEPIPDQPCTKPSQSMNLSESIVKDIAIPQSEPTVSEFEHNARGQTLHLVEPMDEDVMPLQELQIEATDLKRPKENHMPRQMYGDGAVEDDPCYSSKGFKSAVTLMKNNYNKPRSTLLMTEPIEEDVQDLQKRTKSNQMEITSENMTEETKENSFGSACLGPHFIMKRQTMHMNAVIETEQIEPNMGTFEMKQKYTRRRQTVLQNESMEEITFEPQKEPQIQEKAIEMQPVNQPVPLKNDIVLKTQPKSESQEHKRRPTVHQVDPIIEDSVAVTIITQVAIAQSKSGLGDRRRRETVHRVDPIEEDFIVGGATSKEKVTKPSLEATHEDLVGLSRQRRRQTVHRVDPIEVESIVGMVATYDEVGLQEHRVHPIKEELATISKRTEEPIAHLQEKGRRQTVHRVDPIEEDLIATRQNVQTLRRDESFEVVGSEPLKKPTNNPLGELQRQRRRETVHRVDPIEEDSIATRQNVQTLQRGESFDVVGSEPSKEPTNHPLGELQRQRRRETVHRVDPIEEDSIATRQNVQTLQRGESLDVVGSEPSKEPTNHPLGELQRQRRRETVHRVDPIEEDSIATRQNVQTLQRDESFEVVGSEPSKEPTNHPLGELQRQRRRETVHRVDPIEEDSIATRQNVQTLQRDESFEVMVSEPSKEPTNHPLGELQRQRRRQTVHRVDPIEEDSIAGRQNVHTLQSSKPLEKGVSKTSKDGMNQPSGESQGQRRRQTVHQVDPIEEDSLAETDKLPVIPLQRGATFIKEQHNNQEEGQPQLKSNSLGLRRKQSLHQVDGIEEDSFCSKPSAIPVDKQADKYRKRQHLRERMNVDQATTPLQSVSPVKKHRHKNRQTRLTFESIELDQSNVCNENKLEFLQTKTRGDNDKASIVQSDSYGHNRNIGPNPGRIHTKQMQRTPGNTEAEGAMNLDISSAGPVKQLSRSKVEFGKEASVMQIDLLRRTLDKGNISNRLANNVGLETPEMNKKRPNLFAITPGRSMIEYENLEEECKSESQSEMPGHQSIYQADYMELDMDTSNFGTPKQNISVNSKRLPLHLTPNFPEPKKRAWQRSFDSAEKENISSLELHRSDVDGEQGNSFINRNSIMREKEQLDGTVQMVRAQMIRKTDSQIMECNAALYEDNPVTISDVSNHFKAQRALANADERRSKESSIDSRSPNKNCNKSYATVQKKFLNLSGDTEIIAIAVDPEEEANNSEIEKTRLSLVSTLLDEADEDNKKASNEGDVDYMSNVASESCLEQINPPVLAGTKDACQKCKHCRRSLDRTLARRSDEETFVLPDWPDLDVQLQRLDRLRQKPRLSDVDKYWELKNLEFNIDENYADQEATKVDTTIQDDPTITQMLLLFDNMWESYKKCVPKPKPVETFAACLKNVLESQLPNWIFDYNLQINRKYIFSHRKITTFQMCVDYEPMDLLETKVRVCNILIKQRTAPPTPFVDLYDELMDFQLKLNLPLNLLQLLDGNNVEDLVRFLKHVDGVCLSVYNMCRKLQMMILITNAELSRESSRFIVNKTVRKLVNKENYAYAYMERMKFKIEIGNVREISFQDILQPPLHQFDEKIQFLPKGIECLGAILQEPEQYLKQGVDNKS